MTPAEHYRLMADELLLLVRYLEGGATRKPRDLAHAANIVKQRAAAFNNACAGKFCTYPECQCPMDAPAGTGWCWRGLLHDEEHTL